MLEAVEILSQEEIDSMLGAIGSGDKKISVTTPFLPLPRTQLIDWNCRPFLTEENKNILAKLLLNLIYTLKSDGLLTFTHTGFGDYKLSKIQEIIPHDVICSMELEETVFVGTIKVDKPIDRNKVMFIFFVENEINVDIGSKLKILFSKIFDIQFDIQKVKAKDIYNVRHPGEFGVIYTDQLIYTNQIEDRLLQIYLDKDLFKNTNLTYGNKKYEL